MPFRFLAAVACTVLLSTTAPAQTVPLVANLERFDYPAPVHWFEASSQGHPVHMDTLFTSGFSVRSSAVSQSPRLRTAHRLRECQP